ncbi:NGG1p interacting factor NIF3 [Candidatus Berkelbacteria bacterium CG10_big_fil_rev_8_21_14_0_10_43_13]|uniref:NGG1p interacting factor NIF3 n=1 Tax=Candidatus Berkelbacteria bacterium CG10_big_fil_rev_8_21_14_0_10_43_13 TaxID=1974514 RepID=A0A2H0W7G1_9BACT|nr:MAG: NGG1p interacting factor NIF3 [Candidatus Berkelbacteria bacterium CG10_big_fil_rev_8_21_14_0_10_43_13]
MNIEQIFNLAIQTGIDNDPRGRANVTKILKKRKADFAELSKKKQADFDQEKLSNPYSDSGIHFGDLKKEVRRVMVGIDIDSAEVLLANELSKSGKNIDLIIAHHPIGKSLTNLHEVMDIQTDVLERAGVPENIAEKVLEDRLRQVSQGVSGANHYQSIDVAKLLGIPIINIHTPSDNCVWKFVDEFLASPRAGGKIEKVGDIIDALKEIPEYAEGAKRNAGPVIFAGSERSRAGKIVVSGMTGGTSGSEKIYERMSHYGIGTEIAMHIREKDLEEANKHYLNIVIAGHMASDSLGLNIILDKLEKAGIEIVPCSGFIRHSRN